MRTCLTFIFILITLVSSIRPRADLQFDVFPGISGNLRYGNWFPVTVEIYHDGPGFVGTITLSDGDLVTGNTQVIDLELPTNTRKRIQVPMFSGSTSPQLNARLTDEKNKNLAEIRNIPVRMLNWNATLLGALPRSFSGTPSLPQTASNNLLMAEVARIQLDQFPNSPLSFQSLTDLYLNAVRATELSSEQIDALVDWIYLGGHLILAVESPLELNAHPWLRRLSPFRASQVNTGAFGNKLVDWLGQAGPHPPKPQGFPWADLEKRPGEIYTGKFEGFQLQPDAVEESLLSDELIPFVQGQASPDSVVHVEFDNHPLIIQAWRGRGTVTVLAFSPEREPLKSWKQRENFFAKLAGLYPSDIQGAVRNHQAYRAVDGLYGAMVDSRQVRKLPVLWLMVILFAYLIVIGPVDYFWLKKWNKQILTWITFPLYVVFFSGMIYYIGYRLRAGVTEWNEIQVVDVVAKNSSALYRGRTYASLYSPVHATYGVRSPGVTSAIRPEIQGLFGGNFSSGGIRVDHNEGDYMAQLQVPVWTSQLYVSDWIKESAPLLKSSVVPTEKGLVLNLENLSDQTLNELTAFWAGRYFNLGNLNPGVSMKKTIDGSRMLSALSAAEVSMKKTIDGSRMSTLSGSQFQRNFTHVYDMRRQALGDSTAGRLNNPQLESVQVSLMDWERQIGGEGMQFLAPDGDLLGDSIRSGQFIVTAWVEGKAEVQSRLLFEPEKSGQNTLYRFFIPWGN